MRRRIDYVAVSYTVWKTPIKSRFSPKPSPRRDVCNYLKKYQFIVFLLAASLPECRKWSSFRSVRTAHFTHYADEDTRELHTILHYAELWGFSRNNHDCLESLSLPELTAIDRAEGAPTKSMSSRKESMVTTSLVVLAVFYLISGAGGYSRTHVSVGCVSRMQFAHRCLLPRMCIADFSVFLPIVVGRQLIVVCGPFRWDLNAYSN